MRRRAFLAGTATIAGLAGCSSGSDGAGADSGDTGPRVDGTAEGFDPVPLAFLNTFHRIEHPLVQYGARNEGEAPVELRFTARYQGYSEPSVSTKVVDPGETVTVEQTLVPDPGALESVTTQTTFNLQWSIGRNTGDGWSVVREETQPIQVYPQDTMVLWQQLDDDSWQPLHKLLPVFVTPQAEAVQELLSLAKEYHPDDALTGYQCGACSDDEWYQHTGQQVWAIYQALKHDYEMSYLNMPTAFGSEKDFVQRVNTPRRSLELSSANCLDGTFVFASALEALGVEPFIALVPGHAYFAWHAKSGGLLDALETTMLGSAEFDATHRVGVDQLREYSEAFRDSAWENGALVDVAEMRSNGVLPVE